MSRAYYNEHDRFAAAWLRGLVAEGHLHAGDVDERDVQLVEPADLAGYTQCHFFAGIGGWAYALALAEWGDRPVWTGSCPCQPFSSAGKGLGAKDERHLWPAWLRLIEACRPEVVFGEQVAAAAVIGSSDEEVQRLLKAQAARRVSRVLGAMRGWQTSALLFMPTALRGSMEGEEREAIEGGAVGALTEDEELCAAVQGTRAGALSGRRDSAALPEEGPRVRPRSAGVTGADQQGSVRSDGLPSGPFAARDAIRETPECALDRPDRPTARLRDEQRQGRLFGGEHGARDVGARRLPSDSARVGTETLDAEPSPTGGDEQGADEAPTAWLDVVFDDLEGLGYACAAADLPAASVGAPHIRQRLFFVAYACGAGVRDRGRGPDARAPGRGGSEGLQRERLRPDARHGGAARVMADGAVTRRSAQPQRPAGEDGRASAEPRRLRDARRLDDPDGAGRPLGAGDAEAARDGRAGALEASAARAVGDTDERDAAEEFAQHGDEQGAPGLLAHGPSARGPWDGAQPILCGDGKVRLIPPVESGIQPLASGVPNRVGTLRGSGNAIVPAVAAEFVRAFLEAEAMKRGTA